MGARVSTPGGLLPPGMNWRVSRLATRSLTGALPGKDHIMARIRMALPRLLAAVAVLLGAAATASAQVSLVSFQWSSMGSGRASTSGACLSGKCPPVSTCQSDPTDTYTLSGSTISLLSATASATRICSFGCENQGTGRANAVGQAGASVNISDPDISGDVTRWVFGHHVGVAASASLDFPGSCGGADHSAADGNANQSWTLIFDLAGPTLVNLNYSHGVHGTGVGYASSMWTVTGPSPTGAPFLSETIDSQNGPVGSSNTLEAIFPA